MDMDVIHKVEKKLENFIEEFGLPSKNYKIILGISGGVDSVVMLDLLYKFYPKNRYVIVHIDHSIRNDTHKDVELIKKIAKKYALKYYVKKINVPYYCKKYKLGIEEGARKLRYEELEKIYKSENGDFIATAHNLNDLAENFIMRLIRGSGLNGLPGMKPKNDIYIKPLLSISKSEIRKYAETKNLTWREDYTNKDLKYTRNSIRYEVIPLLEKYNPNFSEAIFRLSKILWIEKEFIKSEIEKIHYSENRYGIEIDSNLLQSIPKYLSYEIIRSIIEKLQGSIYGYSFANIEEIYKLTFSKSGATYKKNNMEIRKEYEKIIFFKNTFSEEQKYYLEIFSPGTFKLKNLYIEIISNKEDHKEFPLIIRNYKSTDKIKIKNGHKKIKKLIADKKIPKHLRNKVLIVMNRNNDIIFVNEFETNTKLFENKKLTINIKECETVE
jgi:tRNA(Ile)-lysidine synthase